MKAAHQCSNCLVLDAMAARKSRDVAAKSKAPAKSPKVATKATPGKSSKDLAKSPAAAAAKSPAAVKQSPAKTPKSAVDRKSVV